MVVGWGVGEGVESEEIGGDDGEEHEEVDGGGTEGGSFESGGSFSDFQ